jgi:uncharacterized repeat protein (TIGR03803 family)
VCNIFQLDLCSALRYQDEDLPEDPGRPFVSKTFGDTTMHSYINARFASRTILAIATLVMGTAISAGAQTPGSAQYTTIFNFDNYLSSGNSEPDSKLVADSSGNLYGTTGGNNNNFGGGAFKLTPAGNGTWTESFYGMTELAEGQTPNGLLLDSKTGNLYGTTYSGGSSGCGVVFQLTPPSGRQCRLV